MSVSRRCMPFAHGSYLRTLPQVKIMHLASPAITCMHSVSVSSGLLSRCIKYSSLSLTRKDMYPILATHFLHPCMILRRVAWCYIHMTIRSQNMCESFLGRHKQRSRQQQSVTCHFPGPFAIQACNPFDFMFTVRGDCNHYPVQAQPCFFTAAHLLLPHTAHCRHAR